MFKEAKVVMLPTEDKKSKLIYSNVYVGVRNILIHQSNYHHKNDRKYSSRERLHLYITSDDEIIDGEWCYHTGRKIITQWFFKPGTHKEKDALRKIIATTDSSLEMVSKSINPVYEKLPQPSQSFIKKYVEEYNKGNVITDVLVEYEDDGKTVYPDIKIGKVNPKDNTVTIKKVKDSWTRKEVESLLHKFMQSQKPDWHGYSTTKWAEQNL